MTDKEILKHYRAVAQYTVEAIERAQDEMAVGAKNADFKEILENGIRDLEVHLNAINQDDWER